MKKKRQGTCYACSNPPTTNEHVPPECFFPKSKEAKGQRFRENLIKVPSCEAHNNSYSQHDEYLWALLLTSVRGQISNKAPIYPRLKRALARGESSLSAQIGAKLKSVEAINENGKREKVATAKTDIKKLDESFDKICRGLYYDEYGARFDGKVVSDYNFIYDSANENNNTWRNVKFDHAKSLVKNRPVKGAHPSIFSYKSRSIENSEYIVYLLTFYEGIEIVSWLSPDHYKNYRISFFEGEDQQRFFAEKVREYHMFFDGKEYIFRNYQSEAETFPRPIIDDAPETGFGMLSVISSRSGKDRLTVAKELIERIETGNIESLNIGGILSKNGESAKGWHGFIERDEPGLVMKLTNQYRAKSAFMRFCIRLKYPLVDFLKSKYFFLKRILKL